jgi:hypothetical protein
MRVKMERGNGANSSDEISPESDTGDQDQDQDEDGQGGDSSEPMEELVGNGEVGMEPEGGEVDEEDEGEDV